MNYKEFMKSLMAGEAKGVYLFDSQEEFLNNTIIEEVYNQVNIPDFNLIDIKESKDIEMIKTSYETYPVMEEKKYVIWREIDLSKNSVKEYEDTLTTIAEDLENFPSYTVFLIFSNNPPFKSSKFYKAVKKHGTVVEIARLTKAELESFVGRRFVRAGKKIQKSLITNIVDRFSYVSKDSKIDLYEVVNAVDKIIGNSTDEVVSPDDVNAQLDEVLNLNIFNLTDAMSAKNTKFAVETYLDMARANEDLFMIYHMIIRQIRNLIGVKTLSQAGYNDNFMMKNLGIGNFELKKLKGYARNFTIHQLFDIHKRLFDMEYRQKSEDFDMNLELILIVREIASN